MSENGIVDVAAEKPAEQAREPTVVTARTGVFVPVAILCFLAVMYTAYFAAAIFVPITLAVLLYLLLSPFVRWLRRRTGVPTALGAVLSVGLLLATVTAAFYLLSGPVSVWAQKLPEAAVELEWRLRDLRAPMEDVKKATQQVEKMTDASPAPPGTPEPVSVIIKGPSLAETLMGQTTTLTGSLLITIVLLLFLLASGDTMLRQALSVVPFLSGKKRLVETVRETERDISSYLVTITVINVCLGICVGAAMWLLDMPNPLLWGGVATVFNFIPYLGAVAGVAVVGLAAMVTFDGWLQSLAPPLVFLALTAIEGQFVTPALLARRLSLNPVAVLLSLIVWGWLWGIPGTLLAVPLLAATKIVCDRTDRLASFGALMGRAR